LFPHTKAGEDGGHHLSNEELAYGEPGRPAPLTLWSLFPHGSAVSSRLSPIFPSVGPPITRYRYKPLWTSLVSPSWPGPLAGAFSPPRTVKFGELCLWMSFVTILCGLLKEKMPLLFLFPPFCEKGTSELGSSSLRPPPFSFSVFLPSLSPSLFSPISFFFFLADCHSFPPSLPSVLFFSARAVISDTFKYPASTPRLGPCG